MKERKEQLYLWTLIGISIVSIVPLLWLSFYNHPSADDYMYAVDTYHVWNETHSIWQLLREAVATSADFYQNWQGLYASAFVLALQPAIFGEGYYALTGFLMIGIIYGGNLVFSHYVLHKRLHCSKLESVACGCLVSFVMVQWMPSVVQGLYWFNGTMNYVLFFAVLQCFVCALLELLLERKKATEIKNTIVALLLGVLLAGGNHVTAFMGILSAVAVLIAAVINKKKMCIWRSVFALLAVAGGFIFNVSSPGTQIRQSNFLNTPGAVTTIWLAIKTGLKMINQWTGLAILISFLLFLPIAFRMGKRICEETGFQFQYPLIVLIGSVGWCCAMLCPPIYAMGTTGDLRIMNVIYFSFVFLFFVNGFYLCGWYVALQLKAGNRVLLTDVSKLWNFTAAALMVGMLLACGEDMASYQAMVEIRSGEAQQYSAEADERYQALMSGRGEDVVIKPFSVHPYLLFFDDITQDSADWKNAYMAEYFELNSVVLE